MSTRRTARPGRAPPLRRAAAGVHRLPARHHPVPLLLHGDAVVPAARRGAAGPRSAVAAARRDRPAAPTATCCAPVEDGGQGFLNFIKNSLLVAIGTVVLSLLVAIPGAYAVSRLDFFGRRQISAVFLGVYFFPAILLAIPLFVFFTRIQQRGTLTGLLDRVRRPGRRGVDLHAAQLLRHHPGQPRGGRGDRRLHATAGDAAHQPAAGPAGHRLERPVRLHDRVERVPLRAAVPGREAREVDRLARPLPAGRAASRCPRPC